jgi:hypothetical protein
MSRHNRDQKRRRNRATALALKRLATTRRCASCQRKAAVSVRVLDPWTVIRRCRHCGHEGSSGDVISRKS